jgi:hypothetical protein
VLAIIGTNRTHPRSTIPRPSRPRPQSPVSPEHANLARVLWIGVDFASNSPPVPIETRLRERGVSCKIYTQQSCVNCQRGGHASSPQPLSTKISPLSKFWDGGSPFYKFWDQSAPSVQVMVPAVYIAPIFTIKVKAANTWYHTCK